MNAFLYGTALQWRLDIRSKSLLLSCYVIPLIFFFGMGTIFTTINPEAKLTLIHSMTVLGVTTGTLTGLPATLSETYGSEIKKVYRANGIPLYTGLVTMLLSAFIHVLIMCLIIYAAAPVVFDAVLPENPLLYFSSLILFIIVSLSIGCILGLAVKNNAKLTMVSQIVFMPSIMLSGIMFPVSLLPESLETAGKFLPATWGYKIMQSNSFHTADLFPLIVFFLAAVLVCSFLLKRLQSQ